MSLCSGSLKGHFAVHNESSEWGWAWGYGDIVHIGWAGTAQPAARSGRGTSELGKEQMPTLSHLALHVPDLTGSAWQRARWLWGYQRWRKREKKAGKYRG